MNLNLADVVCTSKDGDQFWKLNECYVRGSSIKYLRLPEEAVERVDEEDGRWKGEFIQIIRHVFILTNWQNLNHLICDTCKPR